MTLTAVQRGNLWSIALCALGLLNVIGFYTDSRVLRGIAAASVASPLPKVFSDVDGLEPFASEFTLRAKDSGGRPIERVITPELYAHLRGPYNRRNVYGAAIAFGPKLPDTLWSPILCYGFRGPLRQEFALPTGMTDIAIGIRTRTRGRSDEWILRPHCAE